MRPLPWLRVLRPARRCLRRACKQPIVQNLGRRRLARTRLMMSTGAIAAFPLLCMSSRIASKTLSSNATTTSN